MLQTQKTKKFNLKSRQKRYTKTRQNQSFNASFFKFLYRLLLSFLVSVNLVFTRFFIFFSKIKKKNVIISSFFFTLLLVILSGSVFVLKTVQNTPPVHVELITNQEEFKSKSLPYIYNTMADALNHGFNRNIFNTKISSYFDKFDIIDEYSFRFGLDSSLTINVKIQKPLFLIVDKIGSTYLIGNAMRIIQKNPSNMLDLSSLPRLSIPDIGFVWYSKQELLRSHAPKGEKEINVNERNSVNFSWLYSQIKIISTWNSQENLGFKIEDIKWSQSAGFSFKLISMTNSTSDLKIDVAPKFINIDLGTGQIANKLKRIGIALGELKKKNLFPTAMDLDYLDKASFRI